MNAFLQQELCSCENTRANIMPKWQHMSKKCNIIYYYYCIPLNPPD